MYFKFATVRRVEGWGRPFSAPRGVHRSNFGGGGACRLLGRALRLGAGNRPLRAASNANLRRGLLLPADAVDGGGRAPPPQAAPAQIDGLACGSPCAVGGGTNRNALLLPAVG